MKVEDRGIPAGVEEAATPSGNRHGLLLVLILGVVFLAYIPTLTAPFCGYDDFNEAHRAAFVDLPNPGGMFTTSHFHTSKYRPLNRVLTAYTYLAGHGKPWLFRVRNLGFHLVGVAAVYGIADSLLGFPFSIAAALLFGLHPLTNQSVVGATWTNTAAYALMFASLFLFMRSWKGGRNTQPGKSVMLLLAAILLSGAALFTYEATLVLFVLISCYIVFRLWMARASRPSLPYAALMAIGVMAVCGSFFAARAHYAEGATAISSPGMVVSNLIVYSGALVIPLDILLANTAFGFPLPSELLADPSVVWLAGICLAAAIGCIGLFGAVTFIQMRRRSGRAFRLDWRTAFLIAAIVSTLLPFLAFTEHASETYLYPGAAFWCMLVAHWCGKFLSRKAFMAVVASLALVFGIATLLRNERVKACGITASRILSNLPLDKLRQGEWNIVLAPFPGDPVPVRYGIYSYAGLGTIDPGGAGAAETSLQVATGNAGIRARAVDEEFMPAACARAQLCFWVHNDGRIEPFRPAAK